MRARAGVTALTMSVALVVAGCGTMARARFASTYPPSFRAIFAGSCAQHRGSRAMCGCALAKMEQAVSYQDLVRESGEILSASFNVSPPAWWNRMQPACRRRPAGYPDYVAPLALQTLLPSSGRVGKDVFHITDACISSSFGSPGPLPAPARAGVADLLAIARSYPLDTMLIPSVGKIDSLRRALTAAVAFLRDQDCSLMDAARLERALGS